MRHDAATIRPTVRIFLASLLFLSIFPGAAGANSNTSARRETAKSQFDRAEIALQELTARPEAARSLKDYTSVVSSFRRVYLITPHAPEVPAALNQVAELYRAMGDLFEEKYYQLAINSYQFLLTEYPTSHYRESAMLAVAGIELNDLHDSVLAQRSYEGFLALHPHSPRATEVRGILEKLAESAPGKSSPQQVGAKDESDRSSAKVVVPEKPAYATDARQSDTKQRLPGEDLAASGNSSQLTGIRSWNADTYTRIVMDVGGQVKYQAARLSSPDRIYFDIENTKISSALLHKSIEVAGGGFVKGVRIAQHSTGFLRVVIEVDRAQDYSVFLLPDPYRLIVDIYGSSEAAEEAARAMAPAPGLATQLSALNTEKPAAKSAARVPGKAADKWHLKSTANSMGRPRVPARIPAVVPAQRPPVVALSTRILAPLPVSPWQEPLSPSQLKAKAKASAKRPGKIDGDAAPLIARQASVKKPGRATKSAHEQAEELGPAATPELTGEGQHSLTRALGLKIGRIVIDAGHGGHDTGTIGPTGLMEKDLCLDVSLRLGKLIDQRLPGAEVVYTREDDTYIPLEQRTEIANQARADLFLSVHANSSQDRKARGIETYYLNFTGSSNAMEVASRENALSENSVYDLQDIVSKIARNEKIEESRDFAGIIQDSLSKRMENSNRGEHNRGVRKAPFVVLIGANMPSVLAEISFISNTSDEQWLKKPENRQRVAEGLYHGIETYLRRTNSITSNLVHPAPGSRSGIVARSGNSQ